MSGLVNSSNHSLEWNRHIVWRKYLSQIFITFSLSPCLEVIIKLPVHESEIFRSMLWLKIKKNRFPVETLDQESLWAFLWSTYQWLFPRVAAGTANSIEAHSDGCVNSKPKAEKSDLNLLCVSSYDKYFSALKSIDVSHMEHLTFSFSMNTHLHFWGICLWVCVCMC